MQCSVEELGKLKRKISVEVPLAEVQTTYDQVFSQLKGNIRVDGFRPGKFPRHLAEKRFQHLMEQEATRTLLPKYFGEAIEELEVRPATQPQFTNLEINKKAPFKFDAEFEIIPPFDLPALKDFSLKKRDPKVAKKQVDDRIKELRAARGTNEDKGSLPAENGDVVTVDYRGRIDGEDFPGNTAQDHPVELGAGRFLPDFEKPLVGVKAGEIKNFEVAFPEDYHAEVAGKTAQFEATVKKVEKKVPPELDEAFFSQFGEYKDLKAFQSYVEKQLLEEQAREIRQEYQQEIIDQIKKKYAFDVPEAMVSEHLHEFEHRLEHDDPKALEDEKKLAKLKKDEEKIITDSIRLNYVIDAWARQEDLRVEKEEVQQRFYMQAYMMRQSPEQLLQSPYGEQMMFQVQQQLLTGKVLDNITDRILGGEELVIDAAKPSGTKAGKAKKTPPRKADKPKAAIPRIAKPKKETGDAAK